MTGLSCERRPILEFLSFLVVGILLALPPAALEGQSYNPDSILNAEGYIRPPDTILQAALAPRWQNFSFSSPNKDGSWYLETISDGMPHIDAFSKPYHELGGEFIDFAANRDRSMTTRSDVGLRLRSTDGQVRDIQVPSGARVSGASFSPDGQKVAFFAHFPDATHIYVADVSNGRSQSLTRNRPVLATAVTSFEWTEDSRYIVTVLIPENRPPMPRRPATATGPEIKVTETGENMVRTYPSLMGTPYDKDLLEWHWTGQLALIQVDNRRVTNIGAPTMVRSVNASQDGEYFRVTHTVRPFAYTVPASSAGRVEELWDRSGTVIDTLSEVELNTGIRAAGQQQGPGGGGDQEGADPRRNMTWAPDGNGLIYLEQEPAPDSAAADAPAAPAGQQEGERPQRARRMDRVIRWVPPFDSASTEVIYETSTRMNSVQFSEDMSVLVGTERSGQSTTTYAVFLDNPEEKFTITSWNSDDFYENPGNLVTDGLRLGGGRGFGGGGFRGGGAPSGTVRMSADGEHVFLSGTQYNENPDEVAPLAFIDQVAIRTGDKTRIYQGDNDGVSESPIIALDLEGGRLIVSRESPTEVEQNFIRDGDDLTQITENVDYTPDLTRAPKHRFRVVRPDGFSFPVSVTLPESFRPGNPMPAMFWFYPREYTDQESYDEQFRTYNKNTFTNFSARSMAFLVRLGYVVVEPESPIVGAEGAMNNNYVYDLRNNLSAVIDTIVNRGWVDRGRIAIGGHSYGAFSTANAMVHTPFFKAGIAGDGNYNRTLTPLSFQNERRILWDAPQVYLGMSPFLYANQLTGALLMYHGLKDQNVGTFTIHSPRMFEALNALDKDAAMYLYPEEDHGPATEETNLDLWARWCAWLDKWVMNPPPPGGEKEEGGN